MALIRKLTLIGLFLLISNSVFAQPLPCVPNVNAWTTTTSVATLKICNSDGTAWISFEALSGSLPSGTIILTLTTCPTGFDEATELNGKTLIGTLAANKDVGTTGGNDNITPTGTNTATSAGTPSGTNSALTFTGTSSTVVVNHVHTLATGTGSTGNFSQVIGTVDTSSGGTGGTPTQTALGTLSGNPTSGGAASYTPAGTINTPTFTGNALGTHNHTFTGNSFDNRSAFVKVIFCKKT